MEFLFPPAIWAALITIVFGAIFALLGIIYNSLRGSIQATGSDHDELEERLSTMEKRVKTLFAWAFGNSKDTTDEGFAGDIQGKLSSLNDKMDELEENADVHHEEVVDRLDELILHLDDEEALEFERDDIE